MVVVGYVCIDTWTRLINLIKQQYKCNIRFIDNVVITIYIFSYIIKFVAKVISL